MRKTMLIIGSLALGMGAVSCNTKQTNPTVVPLTLTCSVAPTSGVAPLRVFVSVTAGGTDPAPVVVNYGDGTTSTDPNAGHLYGRAGTFTLSVTAASGASCSQAVTVQNPPARPPNQPPNAVFKTTPSPATGPNPLTVEFNMCPSSDPELDPLEFSVDVGEGNGLQDSICRKSHTYRQARTFNAKMCVDDGDVTHVVCKAVPVTVK